MREDHITTNQEAIDAINGLFEMNGYKEGKGDLWLGGTLDRLKEFLGDPRPFARHESDNGDDRDYCQCCAGEITINNKSDEPGYCFGCVEIGTQPETDWQEIGRQAARADQYARTPEAIADMVRRASSNITQDGHIVKVSKP